ncbi:MAG: hypothetical protein Ta2A_23230 [Treponemataceae bacterium]|nr:MAG: hypothetical protein Ta2A_23230 [Treponemataceae bacterium]
MENLENSRKMYKKYHPRIKPDKMKTLLFILLFIFFFGLLSSQEIQYDVNETVGPVMRIDEVVEEAEYKSAEGFGPLETVPENVALAAKDYERLANEYHDKANVAWDAGNYEAALEYAVRASENAILAKEYRNAALADEAAATANTPLGDMPTTVSATSALPEFYIVRSWNESKDCFWNIAERSYVYGNGNLWRLLYDANKSLLPNPEDPNVIKPGTKLTIPARKGETRSGTYESAR